MVRVILDRLGEFREVPDVSAEMGQAEQLLQESVAADGCRIQRTEREALMDLTLRRLGRGQGDVQPLAAKEPAAQKLRAMLTARITNLTRLHPPPVDLMARFQKLLDDHNAGTINAQLYFEERIALGQAPDDEEATAVKGGLTEGQQAVADLITRRRRDLTKDEKVVVKRVAEEPPCSSGTDSSSTGATSSGPAPLSARWLRKRSIASRQVDMADLRAEMRDRLPVRIRVVLGRRTVGVRHGSMTKRKTPGFRTAHADSLKHSTMLQNVARGIHHSGS